MRLKSIVYFENKQVCRSSLLSGRNNAGRVACCHWRVTLSMPTGQTDRRTDTRRLHCAFR